MHFELKFQGGAADILSVKVKGKGTQIDGCPLGMPFALL